MKAYVGMDLGTTNSCLAWKDNDEIRIYQDEYELRTMPSIFAQTETENLIGWRAKVCKEPKFRHGFVKRYIGTQMKFQLTQGPVTARDISRYFLEELRSRAQKLTKCDEIAAVVTVPAHFEETHLEETRWAAKEAGLELLELLREPIAAAIAYHYEAQNNEQIPQNETLLVYDLGGGTMDATVCVRTGDYIEVAGHGTAYAGDKFTGGIDFDKALVGLASSQLLRQGLTLSSLSEDLPRSQWLWSLMTSAETCKQELSRAHEVQWLDNFVDKEKGITARLDLWVTRRKFEDIIKAEVEKTLAFCDQALLAFLKRLPELGKLPEDRRECLKLAVARLDRILLVGGSTRVPCIERLLGEHYNAISDRVIPIQSFNPDLCVAIGAAIYASSLATAPESHAESCIEWIAGPQTVGQQVSVHPPLEGRVTSLVKDGATVEFAVGGHRYTSPIGFGGAFRLHSFPLASGANLLHFRVVDSAGRTVGVHEEQVKRGGVSIEAQGLARPIYIQLTDGPADLLVPPTRHGEAKNSMFYVNDRSGVVKAPIFEGHHWVGEISFDADAPPGTAVHFRTLYHPGKIDVQIRVGDTVPTDRAIALKPLEITTEREVLGDRFRKLRDSLKRLPTGSKVMEVIAQERDALIIDIETEFANPIVSDLARIDERIRQLEHLSWRIQAFAATHEAFKQRLESLREEIRDQGANETLLAELDEIAAQIPPDGSKDAETIIGTLGMKLSGISRKLGAKRPVNITAEELNEFDRQMQLKLASIVRDAENDAQILEDVRSIREDMSGLLKSNQNAITVFNRLWEMDFQFLTPLYYRVVVSKAQRGLLRRTP